MTCIGLKVLPICIFIRSIAHNYSPELNFSAVKPGGSSITLRVTYICKECLPMVNWSLSITIAPFG